MTRSRFVVTTTDDEFRYFDLPAAATARIRRREARVRINRQIRDGRTDAR